jgi:hypothetical protein
VEVPVPSALISNGYAWIWKSPCSFSRKLNVNAGNTRLVPSQMERHLRGSKLGWNALSHFARATLRTPSQASSRSQSAWSASMSSRSDANCRPTPSSIARAWRIWSSFLRAMPTKPWPWLRIVSPFA